MPRRPKSPQPINQQAALRIPVSEARTKIEGQIEKGRALIAAPANDLAPQASEEDYRRWSDYNYEMLKRIFTTETYAKEYDDVHFLEPVYVRPAHMFRGDAPAPWQPKVQPRITCLQSIVERLELIEAPEPGEGSAERLLQAYEGLDLQPDIAFAASQLYRDGHYANAIEDAVKALIQRVRMRSGVEKDGVTLMEHVFSPKAPILRFNDLRSPSDQDEQRGFMMLFSGAVTGLRNPRAHALKKDEPERALECIAFVSFLAKLLDETKKGPPPTP
ncbi:MAG TPA: TIGR02391 family protein [Stellaceae bacterium]|nr:TIGR02391 family protein [Stellaceae bacterium]